MSRPETGDRLRVSLDYHLHAGWFRPYLDGLRAGKAVGRRCRACGRTTVPPRRICRCGGAEGDWLDLAPTGTVIAATTGPGTLPLREESAATMSFALVALDGADNLTFGRLAAPFADAGRRVRLAPTPEPAVHPTQAVWFVPIDDQDGPGES